MTYPPQGDPSSRDSTSGYTDYSAQSGYSAQSDYAGQGTYGAQSAHPGQSNYADPGSARPGPPSNVGWAVASILFFWPLAFTAMTRALDVYPLWAAGRYAEAEAASASARKLGMVSLGVMVGLFIVYFVLMIVMVSLASSGY